MMPPSLHKKSRKWGKSETKSMDEEGATSQASSAFHIRMEEARVASGQSRDMDEHAACGRKNLSLSTQSDREQLQALSPRKCVRKRREVTDRGVRLRRKSVRDAD